MSTQHTVYATKLCDHLTKWVKRKSRKLPSQWLSAALMLSGSAERLLAPCPLRTVQAVE